MSKGLTPTHYDATVLATLGLERTETLYYRVGMAPEQALEFGLALQATRPLSGDPIVPTVLALHKLANSKGYKISAAHLSFRVGREYSRVIYARIHSSDVAARWLADVKRVLREAKLAPDELTQVGKAGIASEVRIWWD